VNCYYLFCASLNSLFPFVGWDNCFPASWGSVSIKLRYCYGLRLLFLSEIEDFFMDSYSPWCWDSVSLWAEIDVSLHWLRWWRKLDAERRLVLLLLSSDTDWWIFKPITLYWFTPGTKVLGFNYTNLQQWMTRLAHRWRTLRTAIRNANCRIQWVIEILNAYCTFGLCLEVCLYQCP
jgi:hypothetical protein